MSRRQPLLARLLWGRSRRTTRSTTPRVVVTRVPAQPLVKTWPMVTPQLATDLRLAVGITTSLALGVGLSFAIFPA